MPMTSPDRIELTDTQRGELDRLARAGRTEQRLALRAGIVLAAADGQPNVRIAESLGVCEDTTRKCGGTAGAPTPGCPRWVMPTGPVGVRCSARCRSPRSKRWPAHRRRRPTKPLSPLVVPGTGPAGRDRRDLPIDLTLHAAGCPRTPQTLAIPVQGGAARRGARGPGPFPRCLPPNPPCPFPSNGLSSDYGVDGVVAVGADHESLAPLGCHESRPPGLITGRGKVDEFADVMHADVRRAAAELAVFPQETREQLLARVDQCCARLAVADDRHLLPLQWDATEPGDQWAVCRDDRWLPGSM
jgi:hypothetical protein